ncbi:unnamed protein product [Spirodela intermedia]|uniref:Uncharacterized protein n=1 Tax=Spirodela intermedia TaxID=51605 RepID=A0ABN7E9E6_SPIIN|nr:unnamed protein product [Spirodela intermedia]
MFVRDLLLQSSHSEMGEDNLQCLSLSLSLLSLALSLSLLSLSLSQFLH